MIARKYLPAVFALLLGMVVMSNSEAVTTVTSCEDYSQGHANANLGYDAIVADKVYLVYSGALYNNSNGTSTLKRSNIYVIRGKTQIIDGVTKLNVWVFGAGYGDPYGFGSGAGAPESDVLWYRNGAQDAYRNSEVDACYVDYIAKNIFKASSTQIMIKFLTPHFHVDHINQEFLSWFESWGYGINKLYVHTLDAAALKVECTTPCCGVVDRNGLCSQNVGTSYWAAPYSKNWQASTLSTMVKLGSTTDPECSQVSKGLTGQIGSFDSSVGIWKIYRGTSAHTPGPLYLVSQPTANSPVNYVIKGADGQAGSVDKCFDGLPSPTDIPTNTTYPVQTYDMHS